MYEFCREKLSHCVMCMLRILCFLSNFFHDRFVRCLQNMWPETLFIVYFSSQATWNLVMWLLSLEREARVSWFTVCQTCVVFCATNCARALLYFLQQALCSSSSLLLSNVSLSLMVCTAVLRVTPPWNIIRWKSFLEYIGLAKNTEKGAKSEVVKDRRKRKGEKKKIISNRILPQTKKTGYYYLKSRMEKQKHNNAFQ